MVLCPDCFGELKIEPQPTFEGIDENSDFLGREEHVNIVECPKCGWKRVEKELI